jgi:alpha/beta superfamily hydrolase
LQIKQIRIQCSNVKLYGKMCIPKAVPAPAVLICHGMDARGFRGLKIYMQLAQEACKAGFVSLVFDFRGVGSSTEEFDYGFGEKEDVACALNYLASRKEVAPNSIFVVGHSLGGAVSLYALHDEKRVRGLALWSTPKNHNYNVKKFIRRTKGMLGLGVFRILSYIDRLVDISKLYKLQVYGIDLRPRYVREKLMKLDECDAASRLTNMPLLVVIGQSDVIVGVDEAEEIYRSANEPKTLLVIDSANHNYRGKEQQLISKTIEWIRSCWESGTRS